MQHELFKVDVTYPITSDCITIANEVIKMKLAVCVQILPEIQSIYSWNNAIEHDKEQCVSFKCVSSQKDALVSYLLAHHPYDTPQCIVFKVDQVNDGYLTWANAESS